MYDEEDINKAIQNVKEEHKKVIENYNNIDLDSSKDYVSKLYALSYLNDKLDELLDYTSENTQFYGYESSIISHCLLKTFDVFYYEFNNVLFSNNKSLRKIDKKIEKRIDARGGF